MPGKKPNKNELAKVKVMYDLSVTPTTIVGKLGKSHHTVIKFLQSDGYMDPSIGEIIERIKKKEAEDLYLLGAKARKNLHYQADAGKMRPIENIALMDRVFQQHRLLEGKSSVNIGLKTQLVIVAHRHMAARGRPQDSMSEGQEGEEGS